MESNIEENSKEGSSQKSIFTEETIQKLSDGLVNLCKPDLDKTKNQLKELTDKQELLTEILHKENLKLSWEQNSVEAHKMFDTVSLYHKKLVNIKKDMKSLHDRNIKLKKRVNTLQQNKEKAEYILNAQKEMELKKEQELIAKPGTSGTSSTP